MGACALITPAYLEIALFSGARSGARATGQAISAIDIADISIRALREEGDPVALDSGAVPMTFLSTPSVRRATAAGCRHRVQRPISIHALREEGDPQAASSTTSASNFYPRPPRGGRPAFWTSSTHPHKFLSTPSVRRATECPSPGWARLRYFYPRPPRGGRLSHDCPCALVSMHFYPRPP